jgi:hypothetical protein
MGGVAVLPWDLDQVPEEWLMAFEVLSDDLPKMRKGFQQLDDTFKSVTARFERKQ